MKKIVSVAVLLAAGVATPALAQDGGSSIETYAGVLVGWDNVRAKVSGVGSGSQDGFVYGAVLGAQTSIGNSALIGVEAEVDDATTKESVRDVLAVGDKVSLKAGRDLFIGARLGFHATPSVLVYAKGGYTNARITGRYNDGVTTLKESENLDGYRIGAGAELGTGRLRWRAEYRFSDYGNFKYNGVATGVSTQRHQVMVGAVYAF
jgi:outer membrane immunogenic protein